MKASWMLAGVALVAAVASAPGCTGSSGADACQHLCDCTKDCSPKDEAACEEQAAAQQTLADKASCDGPFDDMTSCLASATCKSGELRTVDCAAEEDAFSKCVDDAGFGGGPVVGGGGSGDNPQPTDGQSCNQALAHYETCTGDSLGGSVSADQCTGMTACAYGCLLDTPCDAFTGTNSGAAANYQSCLKGCGVDSGTGSGG